MAIMSRKKQAVAQGWKAIEKQRNKDNQPTEKQGKEISEEEHKKRIEILKGLGFMKEVDKNEKE